MFPKHVVPFDNSRRHRSERDHVDIEALPLPESHDRLRTRWELELFTTRGGTSFAGMSQV